MATNIWSDMLSRCVHLFSLYYLNREARKYVKNFHFLSSFFHFVFSLRNALIFFIYLFYSLFVDVVYLCVSPLHDDQYFFDFQFFFLSIFFLSFPVHVKTASGSLRQFISLCFRQCVMFWGITRKAILIKRFRKHLASTA